MTNYAELAEIVGDAHLGIAMGLAAIMRLRTTDHGSH
jgi:hypothetical protein